MKTKVSVLCRVFFGLVVLQLSVGITDVRLVLTISFPSTLIM